MLKWIITENYYIAPVSVFCSSMNIVHVSEWLSSTWGKEGDTMRNHCRPKSWICPLHAISTQHFMVNMLFCELFSCIWLCFQAPSRMACLHLCASYSGIRISALTCCFTAEIYRWTDKSLLWFVCVLCVCLCSTWQCEQRPECLTRCRILCKVLMWGAQRVRGILVLDLSPTCYPGQINLDKNQNSHEILLDWDWTNKTNKIIVNIQLSPLQENIPKNTTETILTKKRFLCAILPWYSTKCNCPGSASRLEKLQNVCEYEWEWTASLSPHSSTEWLMMSAWHCPCLHPFPKGRWFPCPQLNPESIIGTYKQATMNQPCCDGHTGSCSFRGLLSINNFPDKARQIVWLHSFSNCHWKKFWRS